MTKPLAERRRIEVAWVTALVALLAVAAALAAGRNAALRQPPQSPGLAAPAFAADPRAADVILVTTKEGGYRLTRSEAGWRMRDRGDYPVRDEAVLAFEEALAGLRFGAPMTQDPAKLGRLGLGDPLRGGEGVRVEVRSASGAQLADIVVGRAPRGQSTGRLARESQAWTLEGELPPLRSASHWLDLRPFSLTLERIARVDVARREGVYAVARRGAEAGGGFGLAPPYSQRPVRDAAAIEQAARGLGALEPSDVQPAPSLTGLADARVTLQTADGLAIFAEMFDRGDAGQWLKLTARANDGARADEAAAINARAGPWAFRIAPEAFAAIAPPLSELIVLPPPPAPAPAPAAPPAPPAAPPP